MDKGDVHPRRGVIIRRLVKCKFFLLRLEHDGANTERIINLETDFYTAYSNVNGYGTDDESIFLESLCDIWQKSFFNTSIDDLMIRVTSHFFQSTKKKNERFLFSVDFQHFLKKWCFAS